MADPAAKRETEAEFGQSDKHAVQDASLASSSTDNSDDAWFSKSLDEFEIPVPASEDDRWRDEDEPEETKPQPSDKGSSTSSGTCASSHSPAVTKDVKRPDEGKELQANEAAGPEASKADGTARGERSRPDRKTLPSEGEQAAGTEGQTTKEEEEEECPIRRLIGPIVVLQSASERRRALAARDSGASLARPGRKSSTGDGEASATVRTSAEDEGASTIKRKSAEDDERSTIRAALKADIRASSRERESTEDSGASKIELESTDDEGASTVRVMSTADFGASTGGRKSTEDDGASTSERQSSEDNAESTRQLKLAEEVEIVEDRDEEWFQRNLNELPTMFNLTHIGSISTPRLQWRETMLKRSQKVLALDDSDDDDDDETTSIRVSLVEDNKGDLTTVVKVKHSEDDKEDEHVGLKQRRMRNSYTATLFSGIQWLLGRRPEAEAVAHRVVRKYPLSFMARANLFYILWKKGAKAEAEDVLEPLLRLKKKAPKLYQRILYEEQGPLGMMYTELGRDFTPDAVIALEKVLLHKPHWHKYKLELALILRRSTNANHYWRRPVTDMVTPLLKAVDLLLDIIKTSEEEDIPEMKIAAASELGEILGQCEFDEGLKKSVGKRALDAGLDAAKCFDIVMDSDFEDDGRWLVRAGKFFRLMGELPKSEKALKRAVAVQDSPKVHHQLALTLRKMVQKERRVASELYRTHGGTRRPQVRHLGHRQGLGTITKFRRFAGDAKMRSLEITKKSTIYQSLFREDKYVNEAMRHFKKSLIHSDNTEAAYDLGMMYKALAEYSDALKQFLMIVEKDGEPGSVVRAFEQAGLVQLEKCNQQVNETEARSLLEKGRAMLNMAMLGQTRIVLGFRRVVGRHDANIWGSLRSLGQYLHQHDVEGVSEEDSTVELWLLRLLRVYADTSPVLIDLQKCEFTDPEALRVRLHKYLRDQRHEETVLFCSLLRLTDQGRALEAGLRDLVTRAHVQAARARLLTDLGEGNAGSTTFNNNMATRLFRWAFEDAHPVSGEAHPASGPGDTHPVPGEAHPAPDDTHPASEQTHPAPGPGDTHPVPGEAHPAPDDTHPASEQTHPDPGPGDTHPASEQTHPAPGPGDTHPSSDALGDDASSRTGSHEDCGRERREEECPRNDSLLYHVLLVHDPRDPEAARAALSLQPLLQNTFGLATHLTEQDSSDVMKRPTLEAMSHPRLLLFVVGKDDTSPELEAYMRVATRTSPATTADSETTPSAEPPPRMRRNLLSLTLDDATTLPAPLQTRPTFPWRPDVALASRDGGGGRDRVSAVCRFFGFLVGHDGSF